jgi:hypothetical protein
MRPGIIIAVLLAAFVRQSLPAQNPKPASALFPVIKDGKLGFINKEGKLTVPCQYGELYNSELPAFKDGRIPFRDTMDKWGLMDADGCIILKPKYDLIWKFHDGYARASIDEDNSPSSPKYGTGCIDKNGKEIIPLQYRLTFETEGMKEGMMAVSIRDTSAGGRFVDAYVDTSGKEHFNKSWFYAGDYHCGLAVAQKKEPEFIEYHPGLAAPPKTSDIYMGYINKNGDWAIPPSFDYAMPFNDECIALVDYPDKSWGIIDTGGNTVANGFTYGYDIQGFSEGLMPVWRQEDSKYGFMDMSGKLAIPFQFDYVITPFAEGRAIVNIGCGKTYGYSDIVKGGQWFVINKEGKITDSIAKFYDEIHPFVEGMAIVRKDHLYGFINTDGKEIIPLQWSISPENFNNGLARYYTADNPFHGESPFGYIDKNGKVIWPATR